MTFMRPPKLRVGTATVTLVGWKMRSMDNIVDGHLATQLVRGTFCSPSPSSWTPNRYVMWCITHGCDGLDVSHLNIDRTPCVSPVLHPENPAFKVANVFQVLLIHFIAYYFLLLRRQKSLQRL